VPIFRAEHSLSMKPSLAKTVVTAVVAVAVADAGKPVGSCSSNASPGVGGDAFFFHKSSETERRETPLSVSVGLLGTRELGLVRWTHAPAVRTFE